MIHKTRHRVRTLGIRGLSVILALSLAGLPTAMASSVNLGRASGLDVEDLIDFFSNIDYATKLEKLDIITDSEEWDAYQAQFKKTKFDIKIDFIAQSCFFVPDRIARMSMNNWRYVEANALSSTVGKGRYGMSASLGAMYLIANGQQRVEVVDVSLSGKVRYTLLVGGRQKDSQLDQVKTWGPGAYIVDDYNAKLVRNAPKNQTLWDTPERVELYVGIMTDALPGTAEWSTFAEYDATNLDERNQGKIEVLYKRSKKVIEQLRRN